ncbi:MAG: protein kinase, partial [Gemmatimonadetes bacterium]|nr:protein kinase [Gemmatimonadota bacterium]
FGVAKAVSVSSGGKGALTTGGVALGTPTYMAPEQAAADPHVDHRADVYAVGVLAYEMLTGRTPFNAPTPQAMLAAHVTQYPDPILNYRPSLPPMLAAAVMRCLEKHPSDRWQTVAELGEILDAASTPSAGMTPVPTSASAPAYRGPNSGELPRSGRIALWFGLATVAVVGVVFGATRIFGLPDWVWIGAVALMGIGFPIVLYTGRVERKRARVEAFPTAPPLKPHHGFFTWRRAILGGVSAIGALLLAAGGYSVARALGIGPAGTLLSSGVVGADDRFVLADFQNRTTDTTLGTSVTEALRVDLGQSRVVHLLSDREIATALTRMTLHSGTPLVDSLATQLAQREGAKAVIAGEVTPLGTGYVLTARVVDAATGETRTAVRATAPDAAHLLTALNDLSGQLRERIGESLRTIRTSDPLDQVTTGSLPALQHYSAGTRYFQAGDLAQAQRELELAVAADSQFAMAYRRLGALLINISAPRSEIVAATKKAFFYRDRLTPKERALTEGSYYRTVKVDLERSVDAYRAVLQEDSLDPIAGNNLGLVLNQLDRFAEAEVPLRRLLRAAPSRSPYTNLSGSLEAQQKWAELDSLSVDAARHLPQGSLLPVGIRVNSLRSQRAFGRMDSLLRTITTGVSNRAEQDGLDFARIDALSALGHHAAAQDSIDRKEGERARQGELGTALELATTRAFERLEVNADTAGARRDLAAALGRYPLDKIPAEDRPYQQLGSLYAELRDEASVRRMRQGYEAAIPVDERFPGTDLRWDSREAQARGDYRAAIALDERYRQASYCQDCQLYQDAAMWGRLNEPDSLLAALERATTVVPSSNDGNDPYYYAPSLRRMAELYEAKGDMAKARDHYQRFIDLWRNADPSFQPQVAEAKRRLAALGGDQAARP